MSTRATYQFSGKRLPTVTLYIHHDGYPQGAAFYFWNMHHCKRQGSHFERFLVANERAEVTQSHEVHGDTEYRYSLTGDTLTAQKRYGYNSATETRSWNAFFIGDWWEFVNKYASGTYEHGTFSLIDGYEVLRVLPDVTVYGNGQRCVFTRAQLVAAVEAKRTYLTEYKAKFPESVGNIWGIEGDMKRAQANLDAFDAMDVFEGTQASSK